MIARATIARAVDTGCAVSRNRIMWDPPKQIGEVCILLDSGRRITLRAFLWALPAYKPQTTVKNHGIQTTAGCTTTCGGGGGFPRSRSALLPGTVLIAGPHAARNGPEEVPQQG
jgi:hypothetical protein